MQKCIASCISDRGVRLYEACDWLLFPRELMEGPSCMRFYCFYILVGPSRVNQNLPQRGDFCVARRASLSLFSKGSRHFSLAWACLDRDLAGSLPARQPSQPQALEIGRLGALPAPGSSAQAPSKQPFPIFIWKGFQAS
jgi:hypothetical protein